MSGTRVFRGPRAVAAASVTAVLTGSLLVPAGPASSAIAPFDALPVAAAPTTVPYAIGTTVYYGGRTYDLSSQVRVSPGDRKELLKVAVTRGVVVTQYTYTAADAVNVIGRLSPTLRYGVLEKAIGGVSTFDVTGGGLVAIPENGKVRNASTGIVYASWTRRTVACNGGSVMPAAVGYRVLEREISYTSCPPGVTGSGVFLWYPPSAVMRLADDLVGVGRTGNGWLAHHSAATVWGIVPANAPSATPRVVASMVPPLVNGSGTRAVVVQSGRVRVITLSSMSNRATALPTTTAWAVGLRDAVPAAWETDDLFLVTARYGSALALVRCSASTGACWRVARTTVRTGVTRIVTERGAVWGGTYVS